MNPVAQTVEEWPSPLVWLGQFLKEELAPFPGRGALIARMVISATIVMLISMTFQIPYSVQAVFALIISRENSTATLKAVQMAIPAFALGAGYLIVGAMLFAADPMLRFLWIVVSLFLSFFIISTINDYAMASGFGVMVGFTMPLWGMDISTELKVTDTLWVAGQTALAAVIATLVAFLFDAFRPQPNLLQSLALRLVTVENLLNCYVIGTPVGGDTAKSVTRLTMLGTSAFRRSIHLSGYPQEYTEKLGVVVALVGRLTDIAGNMISLHIQFPDCERERLRRLAESIAGVRVDMEKGGSYRANPGNNLGAATATPLLLEMEKTISSLAQAFADLQSLNIAAPASDENNSSQRLFARDAFSNPDHIKFALKGCMAASLCYVIYNFLDWPGISTCVVTCLLTALTTIGSSRQKQVLRFTGALAGGAVGMLAQIFILPDIDSIGGFTVLFIAVTLAASWIATSSPRLSYFGIQLAVAFYFVNIQEFKIDTSLVPARDRVVGILLGLVMMWLVFDQLWKVPAAVEMKRMFLSLLQSLARFAREPLSPKLDVAVAQSYSIRETINRQFEALRALTDSVLFEFGPTRQQDLALRARIIRWLPQSRFWYVTRITLLKYRLNLRGFALPEPLLQAQKDFDQQLAGTLDALIESLQGQVAGDEIETLETSLAQLQEAVQLCESNGSDAASDANLQTFLALSRQVVELTVSLRRGLIDNQALSK